MGGTETARNSDAAGGTAVASGTEAPVASGTEALAAKRESPPEELTKRSAELSSPREQDKQDKQDKQDDRHDQKRDDRHDRKYLVRTARIFMRILDVATEIVLYTAIAFELIVLFAQVVMRNFFGFSFLWSDEVAQLALTIITFLGGAYAYRQNFLGSLHIISDKVPDRWQAAHSAFVTVTVAAISLVFSILGVQTFYGPSSLGQTPILGISYNWYIVPFIVGMILICIHASARLARLPWRAAAFGCGLFAVLAVLEFGIARFIPFGSVVWSSSVSICSLVVLLCLGVPIAFVLMIAGSLYLLDSGAAPYSAAVTNMTGGVSQSILLAIPFFILAGYILTHSTLGTTLVRFIEMIMRPVPGGLLHAIVVTVYMFSGLSGSKVADVAAVGSSVAKPADEAGYSRQSVAAVLAASAVMGEAVPPSLAMILLSSVAGVSIVGLFIGGIIPAALIGLLLMAYIFIKAKRGKNQSIPHAGTHAGMKEIIRSGIRALPVMAVPVFLIAGVGSGFASPTEISSIAVIGTLILALAYGTLNGATLRAIGESTAATAGLVLLMTSGASNFSWSLTVAGLPTAIGNLLGSIGDSKLVFVLATIVLLPVLGTVLEGMPAILIFGPIFVPIATHLGINSIQYGIIFVLALGLGSFAPPMGIGLYATCAVCEIRPDSVTRQLLGYWSIIALGLVILALIPTLTLWLPSLVGAG
jgi:tripartite ATP-independent transporter DctM subunit